MEIFKILGTIALNGQDKFSQDVDTATERGKKLAHSIGKGLATAAKWGAAAVGAAASGIAVLTKNSLDSYAEYEQLVGGVKTLFKDSSSIVQQYAANAYKTAGLSANEYMETATSFSASLLQSLGGDTAAAAEYANLAITDMSDNANKMGTDMGMIQNAYQGFAKQNYTMLDNLKLGYGGTKEEMQRLIDDANALNAAQGKMTKYSIDSYADIVSAIHDVQTEMGITDTTADEASETIQGSISATKAAWKNLMTGLAADNADLTTLINNLTLSAATAARNIAPRVTQILNGMSTLIMQLAPVLQNALPMIISQVLPGMVMAGAQLIQSLLAGVSQNIDAVAAGALEIIMMLVMTLVSNLPQMISTGIQLLAAFITGIAQKLPELVPVIIQGIGMMLTTIIQSIPQMLAAGGELIIGLFQGLYNELMLEMGFVGQWIDQSIVQPIRNFGANMLQIGREFVNWLWDGIVSAATSLFPGLSTLLGGAADSAVSAAGESMQGMVTEAQTAAEGAVQAAASAVMSAPELIPVDAASPVSVMAENMSQDTRMEEAGTQAVANTASTMESAVTTAGFDSAGKTAMQKFIDGINSMAGAVYAAVDRIAAQAVARMQSALNQIQNMANSARIPGFATGLDYVPYDDFPARLHKGEAVLTAAEATAWRAGKNQIVPTINVTEEPKNSNGITIIQNIQAVPQTPAEFSAATAAYFEQARWAMA